MKLGQNVCHDEFSDEFENWSCSIKTRSGGQLLKKAIHLHSHSHTPKIPISTITYLAPNTKQNKALFTT